MAVDPIKTFQEGITELKVYEIVLNEEYRITTNKLSHINNNNKSKSID